MPEVKLFATIRKKAGEEGFESKAASVEEILKECEKRYGDELSPYLKKSIVLVNGKNAALLKGRKTRISTDDKISIFPPAIGG